MKADTQRLIGQEIRHQQEALTAQVKWLQRQPEGVTRQEGFRRVNFWRNVLRDAEHRLHTVDIDAADGLVAVNS